MKKVILKVESPENVAEVGGLSSKKEYLCRWGTTLYMHFEVGASDHYWVEFSEPRDIEHSCRYENVDEACRFAIEQSDAEVWQFDTLEELIYFAVELRRENRATKAETTFRFFRMNDDFFVVRADGKESRGHWFNDRNTFKGSALWALEEFDSNGAPEYWKPVEITEAEFCLATHSSWRKFYSEANAANADNTTQ